MKKFIIDSYLVQETDKAIGLRLKRDDGIFLPSFVYFPKSQCVVINNGSRYHIEIPEWLYSKKVLPDMRIVQG